MSAIKNWKEQVQGHHAQSLEAKRKSNSPNDMGESLVAHFRDDPRRTGDPILEKLLELVTPDSTVLDVGGGAGRFALPLALHSRHVTVVEPSESMVAGLIESARSAGIENVSVVPDTWEDVQVEPHDLVLSANVVQDVVEIEPFVRKLESHSRQQVAMLENLESPLAQVGSVWERLYGEARICLPVLTDLLRVLWEMDVYPDVRMFGSEPPRGVKTYEQARAVMRQFLYVKDGSVDDQRLQEILPEFLVESPQGIVVKGARPRRQGLLRWRP